MIVKFYNVTTQKTQILGNVRGFFYTEKVSKSDFKVGLKGTYCKIYLLEGKDKYCIGTCEHPEDCEEIIEVIYKCIKANTDNGATIFDLYNVVARHSDLIDISGKVLRREK